MGSDKIRFDGTGTVVDVDGYLYQVGTKVTATAAELNLSDGQTATATEVNYVADPDYAKQTLGASGAITAGVRNFVFDATAVPTATIAATIATSVAHAGLFTAKQECTDTVGHTITIATGTFDGTNNTATFNAPGEAIIVAFDSAGAGTIVANIGATAVGVVALSTTT